MQTPLAHRHGHHLASEVGRRRARCARLTTPLVAAAPEARRARGAARVGGLNCSAEARPAHVAVAHGHGRARHARRRARRAELAGRRAGDGVLVVAPQAGGDALGRHQRGADAHAVAKVDLAVRLRGGAHLAAVRPRQTRGVVAARGSRCDSGSTQRPFWEGCKRRSAGASAPQRRRDVSASWQRLTSRRSRCTCSGCRQGSALGGDGGGELGHAAAPKLCKQHQGRCQAATITVPDPQTEGQSPGPTHVVSIPGGEAEGRGKGRKRD